MSTGATAKYMRLNVDRAFATAKLQYLYQRTTFFWLRFLDRWVDWCWTGLQRNACCSCRLCFRYSETHLIFCARFLEGELSDVEWGYSEVVSLTSIRYLVIVEPVLLIGDLSEAEAFFLAFEVTRTAKGCFGRERGTPLVHAPLHFLPFPNLSYGVEDIHQARLTQESAWSAWAFDRFPRPSALALRSWYFVRFTSNSVALSPPTIWNTVLSSRAAFLPPQGDLAALCKGFSMFVRKFPFWNRNQRCHFIRVIACMGGWDASTLVQENFQSVAARAC